MKKSTFLPASLLFMLIFLSACGGGDAVADKPAADTQNTTETEIVDPMEDSLDFPDLDETSGGPKVKSEQEEVNTEYTKDQENLQSALNEQKVETCASITDQSLKTACINNILMTQAFSKQDKSYCDQMIGEGAKSECYKKVE